MSHHFIPDKYQTKDKRSNTSEKSEKRYIKTGNQPEPDIALFFNIFPEPNDPVNGFFFKSEQNIDTDLTGARLSELLKVEVVVYPRGFNLYDCFVVDRIKPKYHEVIKCMKQVFRELDS